MQVSGKDSIVCIDIYVISSDVNDPVLHMYILKNKYYVFAFEIMFPEQKDGDIKICPYRFRQVCHSSLYHKKWTNFHALYYWQKDLIIVGWKVSKNTTDTFGHN